MSHQVNNQKRIIFRVRMHKQNKSHDSYMVTVRVGLPIQCITVLRSQVGHLMR
jgi:hypothetical protein